ncbi:ABC transporter substrate-binding protein [Paenibacillus sp. GCM10023248]|uniref:ABC transporter substrate-binding protein n=1 Tax=Bacillales TaxID=1385 RepID=UPI00237915B7|nr:MULTISPECIES: sugar ABC transporter substrate-binding protein [Bacillales]MDD9266295.1 sugar ABC transporter substrate-binding protein [Paenibacillus sp. MAHUQ-63]MDR6878417.1 multiple sugar transport system substrate-binding protein [Bacillus sp. 3255]
MNMSKAASITLSTILLAGTLTACATDSSNDAAGDSTGNAAQSAKPNEPIKLTFASWSISEAATKGALEEMVKKYEEKTPNVKIEFIGIPFADIKQQTFVMASTGNAPDIIQTFPAWFGSYAASDIVTPLDDLMGKEYVDDLMPSFKEDFSYNGKLMGVPWAPTPYILYWNKDLFKKAGLEAKAPATIDEMLKAAKALSELKTDSGEKIYGFGEPSDKLAINGEIALRNLYSFGGALLDKDGKVNANTPEMVNTLNYYKKLVKDGISPSGAKLKDLRNLFSIGRLGMYVDGNYGKAVFRNLSGKGAEYDKVWGAALVPAGVSGKSVSIGEAHGLVISADSKHKQAAADFIKYLTDKEAISIYHKQSDVISARKSLSSMFTETEFDKVLMEQMNLIQPLPKNHPGMEQAYIDIADALLKVSTDYAPTDKVAQELDAKLKVTLK